MSHTNVKMAGYSEMTAEMRVSLQEGDLGRHFAIFCMTNNKLAEWIISDALAQYRAYHQFWSSIGAFAQNYLETAIRQVEPFVYQFSHDYTCVNKARENHWYASAWEQWACMRRTFAIGD